MDFGSKVCLRMYRGAVVISSAATCVGERARILGICRCRRLLICGLSPQESCRCSYRRMTAVVRRGWCAPRLPTHTSPKLHRPLLDWHRRTLTRRRLRSLAVDMLCNRTLSSNEMWLAEAIWLMQPRRCRIPALSSRWCAIRAQRSTASRWRRDCQRGCHVTWRFCTPEPAKQGLTSVIR